MRLVCGLAAVFLFLTPVMAQDIAISGVVRDPQGATVAEFDVSLLGPNYSIVAVGKSDSHGGFHLEGIPAAAMCCA